MARHTARVTRFADRMYNSKTEASRYVYERGVMKRGLRLPKKKKTKKEMRYGLSSITEHAEKKDLGGGGEE